MVLISISLIYLFFRFMFKCLQLNHCFQIIDDNFHGVGLVCYLLWVEV